MTQNIWIVTIGSSDVQLKSIDDWGAWYSEIEDELPDLEFEPTEAYYSIWGKNDEENEEKEIKTYRVHARVLGMMYSALPDEVGKHLTFPLLERFVAQIEKEKVSLTGIVVFLTDQEKFFTKRDKSKDFCPYWQDTVTLKQALEYYLRGQFLHLVEKKKVAWIELSPKRQHTGLDHWDDVLKVIQEKFSNLKFNEHEINLDTVDKVYVSHQAGTPAISSAVQFVSLAKFGKQVHFLVSNEYSNKASDPIKSSSYLKGIKLQEAEVLLERFDYEGLQSLFSTLVDDWNNPENIIVEKIKSLLEVASLWNHAKFEDFAEARGGDARACLDDKSNWWWMAYELAYLSIVRFRQGNMVEAMFHSFRALEGLVINYHAYHAKVENSSKTYGRKAFNSFKSKNKEIWDSHPYIKDLIRSKNSDDIVDRRNNLFHQLKGFHEKDLYSAWKAVDEIDWKNRILSCLNLVSNQSIAPPLEKANLMFRVHDELKNAISQYAEMHE